jgi:hypothetical protein
LDRISLLPLRDARQLFNAIFSVERTSTLTGCMNL